MAINDGAASRRYHDATKHSALSIRRDQHVLDWDSMPIPFKVYTELDGIPLARDLQASGRPALQAIADPGRRDDGAGPPPAGLDLGILAHVLYFSAGVLRRRATQIGDTFFRAAACTGNLHHIEIYLACGPLPDLEAGVYHFGAHDFALRRLRAGDHRAHVIEATAGEPRVAAAPVVLALTTTFWRNAWKYRARAYRHAYWDGGTLLANLLAVAAARDLSAGVVLGFVDDVVNALVGADAMREAAIALVALGEGAAAPPPAPPLAPLAYEVLPLSEREVDYPEIRAAHAATSLATADEVAAWRAAATADRAEPSGAASLSGSDDVARTAASAALEPPAGTVVPLAPEPPGGAPADPIEAVILRRGSTRFFSNEPISLETLSAILRTVTRGIPGDFLPPRRGRAEPYLIVHAVEGLAAGAWWYDRAREALALLRPGSFRREAGFLGLGQEIPADAAANVYWLTDLDPVLARLGGRGYRAAALEAGIEGGKTYLAAYALRLGASGLTFFDDEVTAFFSPHAAGKSVMFLMAVGVPRPLRRDAGRG
jgi:SagB-type dehydrogenase family enzyme